MLADVDHGAEQLITQMLTLMLATPTKPMTKVFRQGHTTSTRLTRPPPPSPAGSDDAVEDVEDVEGEEEETNDDDDDDDRTC